MTKYKIFLALYTRRMSCLGPIAPLLGTGPLERGVALPSRWKKEKHLREACSTPKEHQESGVRECSYLQSGILPLLKVLSGAECTLQNLLPGQKKFPEVGQDS